MKLYAVSRTQAGIERRAQQRQAPTAAGSQERAPAAARKADNVVNLVIPRTEVQQIIADIAHKHGLTYADILSPSRFRNLVTARYEAIAAVKTAKPMYSLLQLGRLFHRDHSTIVYALRKAGMM
ncbi:helix-turn-helix domain-containing protein [Mesorhizobium sp.]|uniref:helix-turn-helix domain-containing protein n=1 Tax=Mesorhizobium sp. TaxID=1871066 RepID=UPI0011FF5E6E|nr:helix-turn-helix domain-containing protein [Mesorhizobium sp.]TIN80721.1 MAG: hypothetical protein E5Y09_02540 [Mesorhizobium sp.]